MSTETNRLLSNIKDIMHKVWKKLCDGIDVFPVLPEIPVEGEKCDGTRSSETANGIYQTIPHPDYVQKVQICKSGLDPEPVCLSNDGGETVVTGWEVFDTSTDPPTSKLYVGGVEVSGYEVVPCNPGHQYDYEHIEKCVDGKTWTQWFVWDKLYDGDPNIVSILWIDENGLTVPAPDASLIDNENCKICNPEICSATGDDLSTLCPAHNFSILKDKCCKIKVNTSIGSFIIPETVNAFSTSDFECTYTIDSVEILKGNCSLDTISIIGSKLK
jgi:hypothetical protein